MVRAPSCEKSGLKKGTWTPEEDRKLIAYVTRYGCWNWRQLPRFAGLSRCGKSCRLRWLNYLRPNIKRGNYTKEEEEAIMKLHEKLGNRWSAIAAHLPGRTDNEIKNHWHTNLKKRAQQNHDHSEKATTPKSKDDCCSFRSETQACRQAVESEPEIVDPFNSARPPILETGSLSPQTSMDEISRASTDSSAASHTHFSEDDYMNDLDKLLTDPMVNDSMWPEPLVEESWYTPSEIYTDTELLFPSCDGEILRQSIMYEEYQGLFE